jgi:excisionase family DNA binding protein
MQMRETRRLNTAKEQAEELNCSLRHLENLKAKRQIPFIRLGKSIRFDPVAVERALEKLTVKEVG